MNLVSPLILSFSPREKESCFKLGLLPLQPYPLAGTASFEGRRAASRLLGEGWGEGRRDDAAAMRWRTRHNLLSPVRLLRGNSWRRSPLPGQGLPRGILAAFVFFFFAAALFSIACQAEPNFPPLSGRIVDNAQLLTPADKAAIESDLKALEDKSSDQIVVYTTKSLQGYPIEDYGYQLGRAWGIGQKGTNNGVILIVAPNERKVRIEVGRGLEPQMTDLLSKLIIQNTILPRFKRGEFSAGVKAGVQDIRDVLLGDAEAVKERAAARPEKRNASDNEELITLVIVVAIFLFVLWVQSQQAGRPLSGGPYTRRGQYGGGPIFFPGDWSGGGRGGGDGGGWSGGGGDFGGGGASGDW